MRVNTDLEQIGQRSCSGHKVVCLVATGLRQYIGLLETSKILGNTRCIAKNRNDNIKQFHLGIVKQRLCRLRHSLSQLPTVGKQNSCTSVATRRTLSSRNSGNLKHLGIHIVDECLCLLLVKRGSDICYLCILAIRSACSLDKTAIFQFLLLILINTAIVKPKNGLNVLSEIVASVTVGDVQRIHKRNDRFKARHLVIVVAELDNRNLAKDVRCLVNDLITDNGVNPVLSVNRTSGDLCQGITRVCDSHTLSAISIVGVDTVGVERVQNNKIKRSDLVLFLLSLWISKHITQSCDFKVMCKLYILSGFALFPTHFIERCNPLVILVDRSLSVIVSCSLDKHKRTAKLKSNLEVGDKFCIVGTSLDVNVLTDLFDTVEDRLIAFLVLDEVFHLVSVDKMVNHRLVKRSEYILVLGEVDRVDINSLATSKERRHRLRKKSVILFFVSGLRHLNLSSTQNARLTITVFLADTFVQCNCVTKKSDKTDNFQKILDFFNFLASKTAQPSSSRHPQSCHRQFS